MQGIERCLDAPCRVSSTFSSTSQSFEKNHVLNACFEVLISAITHVSNSDYKDRNYFVGIGSLKTSYFHFLVPQDSRKSMGFSGTMG